MKAAIFKHQFMKCFVEGRELLSKGAFCIAQPMNGIFTKVLRSFPVPFHRSLGLLRSYHIPKTMDSVPERELFFPFLNMYELNLT